MFFGGDAAFGPKNIIWAVAHGHEAALSIDKFCSGEDINDRPQPMVEIVSQKMGIHEWSYDNDIAPDKRYRVPLRDKVVALRDIKAEVELGFDVELALKEAQRCLNCDVQTVFESKLCIECDACVDICPMDCITFTENGEEADLRTRLKAPAKNLTQDLYVANDLKTGRVMVKDEDVCLHCGLCAERCPTGAWDMKKYLIDMTHADDLCRAKAPISSVNDFVVRFANVNGSGSASANELFARSVLRMGVPVAPRNIFPSNIQGLPTWYEVRISEAGHLGARGGTDLMVAMNPQTWDKDVASIEPGGYLLYDSTKPMPASKFRDDITVIGVPLTAICNREYTDPRQRQLFKNIIYVGALSALLDMDVAAIEKLIERAVQGQGEAVRRQQARAASRPRLGAAESRMPDRACASSAPTRSATASSSRATARPRSAPSMAAPPCAPGIRSRRRPRWPTPSPAIAGGCASIRRPRRTRSRSCRPRTNWPRSAW